MAYHYNLVANIVISRLSFSRQTTQTDPMYSTCAINKRACYFTPVSRPPRDHSHMRPPPPPPQRLWLKLRHYYRRPLSTGGLFRRWITCRRLGKVIRLLALFEMCIFVTIYCQLWRIYKFRKETKGRITIANIGVMSNFQSNWSRTRKRIMYNIWICYISW